MPIMKYTPQFVERQYIPMNDLGLIQKGLETKQKQWDTSKAYENQMLEQLYGISTTTGFSKGREQLIGNVQKQIEEAVSKRGGDYGAAVQDIAGIIARTGKDPFFNLNRIQMENVKGLERQLAQNPNLKILKDPRSMEYNPNLTEQDLNYQVLDPNDIATVINNTYGHLRSKEGPLQAVNHPVFGTIARSQKGLSDAEIAAMRTPETVNKALAQLGYSDLEKTNPELYNELSGMVYNQLGTLNMGYNDAPWSGGRSGSGSGSTGKGAIRGVLQPSGRALVPETIDEATLTKGAIADQLAASLSKEAGLDIGSFQELKELSGEMNVNVDKSRRGTFASPKTYPEQNLAMPSAKALKAREVFKQVEQQLTDKRSAPVSLSFNRLASADPEQMTKINRTIDQFNENFIEDLSKFSPLSKTDRNNFDAIKDKTKMKVVDVTPLLNSGKSTSLVVTAQGFDDQNKPVVVRQYLKRNPDLEKFADPDELKYYGYLMELDEGFQDYVLYNIDPQLLLNKGYSGEDIKALANQNQIFNQ